MKKRLRKFAVMGLTAGVLLSSIGPATNVFASEGERPDEEKYVNLDGDWHFKLYRTYDKMFQYLPYGLVSVTWEDNALAHLPSADIWSSWETVKMPADDPATGGLLPLEREKTAEDATDETEGEGAAADETETESPAAEETETETESPAAEETETETESPAVDETETETEGPTVDETESPAVEETESTAVEETETESAAAGETESNSPDADDMRTADSSAADESTADTLNLVETEAADNDLETTESEETAAEPFFPSWSEAWVCRSFELPEDFTEDEEVTLLLGIVDDMDVVYINGQLVAGSGFADGTGKATLNIPETGGFDYSNAVPESQVQFEKSYWEVAREYKIPSDCLNIGGTNTICIRVYNNNGYGGFYSGNIYALCGNETAVRKVKGLPTDNVDVPELIQCVERQNEALENKDYDEYSSTIYENYHNDGTDKAKKIDEVKLLYENYSQIEISDSQPTVYSGGENLYWYAAHRVIYGVSSESGERELISENNIEECYIKENECFYERGNWNRCYTETYDSGLFNKELKYSIYLPPSYYENTEKSYPTVYLLHGINSSSESFVKVDGIPSFMDQYIESGEITEMIVVMPDSGKNSFYRDTAYDEKNPDSTGPWQTHITTEIRNEVEKNYRVLADAKFRGLTGISMGGFGAVSIGTLYPELYSSVASHMGAVNDEALADLKTLTEEQLEGYDFYFDCGLQDTMVDYQWTVNIHNYLDSIGKEHGYDLRDGGHNSAFYMAGMPASMKMHSDHFLKNGLTDEENGETEETQQTDVPEETEGTKETVDETKQTEDIQETNESLNGGSGSDQSGEMDSVKTGDHTPIGLIVGIMLVSIITAAAAAITIKKRMHE